MDDVATKPFRDRCRYVFDLAFGGEHHVTSPKYVEEPEDSTIGSRCQFFVTGDLATWDFNTLTALVVAGHDAALRVGISGGGPRKLKIILWARRRTHDNATVFAHPRLEDHIALIRGELGREEFYARLRPTPPSTEQRTLDDNGQPRLHVSLSSHRMTRCQSDDDGACDWEGCPQNRDGEPHKSGRHCPLDQHRDDE